MLLAGGDLLEVVKEHDDNSGNLFPAAKVKNLAHFFDNGKGIVLKEGVRELMIAQDPKQTYHIVADLWALDALGLQNVAERTEACLGAELTCKLVLLQDGQQSKSIGVNGHAQILNITLLSQPVEEFSSLLLALLILLSLYQNCENMTCDVSLDDFLARILMNKAVQDLNQIYWLLEVAHDL